jgi:multiple sugar transport system permease protein
VAEPMSLSEMAGVPARWRAAWRVDRLYPQLLIAPVILLVGVGIIFPLLYLLYMSFHDYNVFYNRVMVFNGFANYGRLLADPLFWKALRVSVMWVVGSVVPQFLVGLVMALLLNESFPGRGFVRTIILLPWVVSGVVTAILWGWMFDGTIGVINDLLMKAHFITLPIPWAALVPTTWVMVLVANTWRGAPFFAIMLLAALQAISPDLYEAATVDGADRLQRFRLITLPMLMNAIVLSTLLRAIWTFNFVDLIWTLTHGGPMMETRTLAVQVLQSAYTDGDFGYAAALAVAFVVILALFSALYWRLNRLGYQP